MCLEPAFISDLCRRWLIHIRCVTIMITVQELDSFTAQDKLGCLRTNTYLIVEKSLHFILYSDSFIVSFGDHRLHHFNSEAHHRL